MKRLWQQLIRNLFAVLGLLLGVMQVLVGHWVIVVVAGREGPGVALGLALMALLIGANAALFPVLRLARRRGGLPRLAARAYVSVGLATLLLGSSVLLSWLGFLPLTGLLSLAGVSPEAAFAVFRVASGLVVGTLAAMLAWGFTVGRARLDHTHIPVTLRNLHPEHRGLRIVQISDLHIGNALEGRRLDRLVDRVNALEADLLAVTGDIFDFDPAHVEDGARRLGRLRARLGVFAVLGNHDGYTGSELVADSLGALAPGLRLLRGEVVRLPTAEPLYVAGIDDPSDNWTDHNPDFPELEALWQQSPGDGPVVLLVHRPEAFPQAARLGFPLVLAGHTHGGQLALPTADGRHNMARFITRFGRGLYREQDSQLYVNRGVGFAGPTIRLNCPREIATLELC